jgi:hypothetical protein
MMTLFEKFSALRHQSSLVSKFSSIMNVDSALALCILPKRVS